MDEVTVRLLDNTRVDDRSAYDVSNLAQLRVTGVPDHLQYGRSLQSVALIHGTALIEALAPGLSADVSFDDLVRVSATLCASPEPAIQALLATTLVRPALLYASAHQAVELEGDATDTASAAQIATAMDHLKARQDAHAGELQALLSLKAPDRRQLADNLLRESGIAEDVWTLPADPSGIALLQTRGFSLAWSYSLDRLAAWNRPQASLVELVMMGELWRDGQSTIPEAYERAWQVYEAALLRAQTAVIARLFGEMQPAQRELLLKSTCELNRVRFQDGEGTHGLLIRCRQVDQPSEFHNQAAGETFFELFPAAGVVRLTTQRFDYHPAHRSIDSINLPELWRNHEANLALDAKAPFIALNPFDSDAYLYGQLSRSAKSLHTPALGELVPAAQLCTPDSLASLASAAARHLLAGFLKQSKQAHRHLNGWEQTWAKEREWADTAARWLVPFYGCIKDLSSGEHSAAVVAQCSLDTAFALIPLGQFVSATTRIVLRAGELSVVSLGVQGAKAVAGLAEGLAQQSAAFLARDVAQAAALAGQSALDLLHELPSFKRVFASSVGVDWHESGFAMRQLAGEAFSPEGVRLQRVERSCRMRRDLVPVACTEGIVLQTPPPLLPEEPLEQVKAGHHYSHAMAARRFELATLNAGSQQLHVFVHENRLFTWKVPDALQPSSSTQAVAARAVEVSIPDKVTYNLPLQPQLQYRQRLNAQQLQEPDFGVSAHAMELNLNLFEHQEPVIRLGGIVEGVEDARVLRGSCLFSPLNQRQWIYIEADHSIFYRAPAPTKASPELLFERLEEGDPGLADYLSHTEQYRLVREVPSIWQDRQNIARMLFDMLNETERALLPEAGMTFEQYDQLCHDRQWTNQFFEYATNVLSGKSFQDAYIELARQTVADFRPMAERSPAEVQPLLDVLNNLLPAKPVRKGWQALSADNIVQPAAIKRIRKQVNGANLAFACVHVDGRQAYVFYAVSGGRLGENVRLQPEWPWTDGSFINGVDYIDAHPRRPTLVDPQEYAIADDPRFTTLPTLRHADRLQVRAINRSLDSERLIGTRLKDELQDRAGSVTRIDFFTLLDACRSCGGFALPRLKHDFPTAEFSVTYLKPYQDD
ncbi:hypothetical protein NJC40_25165 [Pseudomonas sp. 21LCFQ02]|uniref:deaminase domain-containing protein n=1 Tax=Pseudomonas sp. 21LCFQ02 TaxID=2957505 RepID=UPI00209B1184|nr:deaminase domain-containing protein [Pseudomonas sp. 21LCFQ02]MCO8171063.1 hypothetical protein [Pseudomonas sp. 21LCFQ02]